MTEYRFRSLIIIDQNYFLVNKKLKNCIKTNTKCLLPLSSPLKNPNGQCLYPAVCSVSGSINDSVNSSCGKILLKCA